MQSQQVHHLNPRYSGPFKVLKFQDNNTVIIIRDGKHHTININKIKRVYGFSDPPQVLHSHTDSTNRDFICLPLKTDRNNDQIISHPPSENCNKKKTVTFTSFVRIWDPERPKHAPYRCVLMKQ